MYVILALSSAGIGTPNFAVNRKTKTKLFQHLLEAHVKQTTSHGFKKDEDPLLGAYRYYSTMFDPAVAEIITTMEKEAYAKTAKSAKSRSDKSATTVQNTPADVVQQADQEFQTQMRACRARIDAVVSSIAPCCSLDLDDDNVEQYAVNPMTLCYPLNPIVMADPPVPPLRSQNRPSQLEQTLDSSVSELAAALARLDPDMKPRFVVDMFSIPHKDAKPDCKQRHYMMRVAIFDPKLELTEINPAVAKAIKMRDSNERLTAMSGRAGRWLDPYLPLIRFRNTHPAFTYTPETYRQHAAWFRNTPQNDRGTVPNVAVAMDVSDAYHPTKFLTFARACQILAKCGADVSQLAEAKMMRQCDDRTTTILPGWTCTLPADQQKDENYRHYPDVHVYRLDPEQVFWYDERKLGLAELYWPDCGTTTNYCRMLMEFRGDPEELIAEAIHNKDEALAAQLREKQNRTQQLVGSLAEEYDRFFTKPVITRDEMQRTQPTLVGYKTGNILIHQFAERRQAEGILKQAMPADPFSQRAEYDKYCRMMTKYLRSNTEKFCSVWLTSGAVQDLPLPPTIRIMLKWFQDGKFKSVTRPLYYSDPQMSMNGNLVAGIMLKMRTVRTVIQPVISLLSLGLQSTYDHRPNRLKFHIVLCGGPDTGKTFMLINQLMETIMIPGTCEMVHRSSKRAKNTDTHINDIVYVCDEPPQFLLDDKAEAKFYDEVQDLKATLQSGQRQYMVFKRVVYNGQERRIADNIITDDTR